tara:strand:+ start:152 stop:460 length:309 start_codon:yes stop_codon:yes gene_type:complete
MNVDLDLLQDQLSRLRKNGVSFLQDSEPLPENGYTIADDATQIWLEVNGYTVIIIKGETVEGTDEDVPDKGIRVMIHKTDDFDSLMKDQYLLNEHYEEITDA